MKRHAQFVHTLHRIWNTKGLVSTLLLPLSWCTRAIVNVKKDRYARNPERVWQSPLPVVVVGNIYVGGTGKTPVVMAVVNALTERGWQPGVISRGYGVKIGPQARTGQGNLDPARFGDEPALIANSTDVPVAVHPSRTQAAQALIQNYPSVDVIVADDGLQHLALGRDAEIIVQDTRGTGNGRLLPAGPLREPVAKLTQVDVVITNTHPDSSASGQSPHIDCSESPDPFPEPAVQTTRKPLHVAMSLLPYDVIHVNSGFSQPWSLWLEDHIDTPLNAVAAIGHPDRFFGMLRHNGLTLNQTRALPDHTAYTRSTFDGIDNNIILITTKDAVKCRSLNDDRLWAVRVTPHFSDTRWLDLLHTLLTRAAQRKTPGMGSHNSTTHES